MFFSSEWFPDLLENVYQAFFWSLLLGIGMLATCILEFMIGRVLTPMREHFLSYTWAMIQLGMVKIVAGDDKWLQMLFLAGSFLVHSVTVIIVTGLQYKISYARSQWLRTNQIQAPQRSREEAMRLVAEEMERLR